jgi:hypothetical protein
MALPRLYGEPLNAHPTDSRMKAEWILEFMEFLFGFAG